MEKFPNIIFEITFPNKFPIFFTYKRRVCGTSDECVAQVTSVWHKWRKCNSTGVSSNKIKLQFNYKQLN